MIGAIIGDIAGSRWEARKDKPNYDFELFHEICKRTDDSVLSIATADCIMNNIPFAKNYKKYYNEYPAGYGGMFSKWASSEEELGQYYSYGNGSAMRVSAIGWLFDDVETIVQTARESSGVTHNHPEGMKGATAVALAVYLARTTHSKEEIKKLFTEKAKYNLDFDFDDLVQNYKFYATCQASIPQAVYTFLISDSFEDSIRKAIQIGGDSDTIACINGAIAEAYYGEIPKAMIDIAYSRLEDSLLSIVEQFNKTIIKQGKK